MNFQDAFDEPLKEGHSLIATLDPTGDTKIMWDRSNPTEAAIALDAFNKARANGFMAYRVLGADGAKGEILTAFDAKAERIILAPPLKGGR